MNELLTSILTFRRKKSPENFGRMKGSQKDPERRFLQGNKKSVEDHETRNPSVEHDSLVKTKTTNNNGGNEVVKRSIDVRKLLLIGW